MKLEENNNKTSCYFEENSCNCPLSMIVHASVFQLVSIEFWVMLSKLVLLPQKAFGQAAVDLKDPQPILDCRAVTTIAFLAPSHNRTVCKNRRKCTPCGMNLLDIS
jgi:hypothetical protein